MAFLAAAAAKKAAAPAPAPTPGASSPAPAPAAAGAASGSTQGDDAKRSILNVLGKRTDLIPAADRRIMTDKETIAEQYTNGSTSQQVRIEWPDIDDMRKPVITVKPKSGFWKGGVYNFELTVPDEYPHKPPDVKLAEKIYHPNIDYNGNVCLDLLRKDWKPVYTLEDVVIGLEFLLLNPEGDDPLNLEVGAIFRDNPTLFKSNVRKSLGGSRVDGQDFPRFL